MNQWRVAGDEWKDPNAETQRAQSFGGEPKTHVRKPKVGHPQLCTVN